MLMDRENLYYVLFEQQKEFEQENSFVPREQTKPVISSLRLKLPLIITGVRRAGKSTLLKLVKKELNLKEKEYLYINFNDERLTSFSVDDFQKILDYLQEENYKQGCYLFIDEIQEVEKWEKWVDRIKEKHKLLITGSNSKLLSKEISTVLTGRSINISLYPFSFREFLRFKNISLENIEKDLQLQTKIRRELTVFLALGGIPKVVTEDDQQLLSELYENIIYRDIIKRFNATMEKPIKETSLLLLSLIGKEISSRTLSSAIGIKNFLTIKAVLASFEKAFLFFFILKFDFSVRKQLQNPRKVYCIDTGFVTKLGFRFSEEKGRLLENLVFIELKRRNKEVYYFSGKGECDFVVREGIKIKEAIQVCYSLNDDNKDREFNGLLEALEKFNLKEGLILTFEKDEEVVINKKKIRILPVWKWLLEKH